MSEIHRQASGAYEWTAAVLTRSESLGSVNLTLLLGLPSSDRLISHPQSYGPWKVEHVPYMWNWIRHWFHYILVCKKGCLLTRSLVCTLYLTLDCYYRCKEPHPGQYHWPWPPWSPTEAAVGQSEWGCSDRVSPPSWPRAEEHLPDWGLQTSIWLLLY